MSERNGVPGLGPLVLARILVGADDERRGVDRLCGEHRLIAHLLLALGDVAERRAQFGTLWRALPDGETLLKAVAASNPTVDPLQFDDEWRNGQGEPPEAGHLTAGGARLVRLSTVTSSPV